MEKIISFDLSELLPKDYERLIGHLKDYYYWSEGYCDLTDYKRVDTPRLGFSYQLKDNWRDIEDLATITRYKLKSKVNNELEFGESYKMVSTFYNHWLVWLIVNKKIRYLHVDRKNRVWVS